MLSQPALANPTAPLVIPWSTGPQSSASQLDETANATVSKELATPAGDEGPLDDLFRLALPAGLGEQGPLVEAGLPAVRLSADGELPLESGRDVPESFDNDTFDRFGRAALSLILALDSSPGAVVHGPKGYIGLAGNLMPGWTIALLALSLLVPAGLAAGSGLASAARSPIEAVRGFVWSLLRALPFLGALAVFLLTALVGLMPSPDFPFDPRVEALGAGGTISVILALLFYCVSRVLSAPAAAAARQGGRDGRPGGAAAGLPRHAWHLARQPLSRAGRLDRAAGMGAGRVEARSGPAGRDGAHPSRAGAGGSSACRPRRALRCGPRRLA